MNINRNAGKSFTEMCGRGVLPFGTMCFRGAERGSLSDYTLYALINPRSLGVYENGLVNLLRVSGTVVRRWDDNGSKRGWHTMDAVSSTPR